MEFDVEKTVSYWPESAEYDLGVAEVSLCIILWTSTKNAQKISQSETWMKLRGCSDGCKRY